MDENAVAAGIGKIHEEYTSVIQYHNENSLSCVPVSYTHLDVYKRQVLS